MIREITSEELREVVFRNGKTIVQYFSPACESSKKLTDSYKKFSDEPAYRDISFYCVQASENPVAAKEIKDKKAPFISTYMNGLLIECRTVSTKDELKQLIDYLQSK